MRHYLPYLLNAFLLTAALIPVCARQAGRIGLVDQANGRKRHVGHVPVVGGIAMFAAILVTATMLGEQIAQYGAFFTAMSLLVGVGILDDSKDLSAAVKAVAQFAGALIMTLWGGMVIVNLGTVLGAESLSIPYTGIPFTVFCVVGLINALNMADGADGLAGGLSLTAFVWFFFAAFLADLATDALVLSVVVAALAGFMLHNMRSPWRERASVFMGDAGSMMLGFALSWFAVKLSQGSHPALNPVTVLWILALPTVDAMIVIVNRLLSRRSPFAAGVDHLHHVLQACGFSVQQTVLIMVGASAILGGIGFLGMELAVPQGLMLVMFLLLIVLHFKTIAVLKLRGARAGPVVTPSSSEDVSAAEVSRLERGGQPPSAGVFPGPAPVLASGDVSFERSP